MEYLPSAIRIDQSPSLTTHGARWLTEMDKIIKELHDNDYVHGDLHHPNFIADRESLWLIDFDWGGKQGEANS